MQSKRRKVLVVDDDPSHLEIYGLLVEQAGYEPVAVLVRFIGADFPVEANIEAVILDHRLNSMKTSAELAREIYNFYGGAPIILLSDALNLPADIAPYVADLVLRGEPALLLEKLCLLLSKVADGAFEEPAAHIA
jgi:CheY-like chemotaxis protein